MRLGLCCTFFQEAIRFRLVTARVLSQLGQAKRVEKLRSIAAENARALGAAIEYCARHGIGAFRINSQILPLKTHPQWGYDAQLLGETVIDAFRLAGRLARQKNIRLTFHPDQFVVLSSPHPKVQQSSLAEIEYQAEVAGWIGADVINIHGGGGFGDKPAALRRFAQSIERLSEEARAKLSVENDDRIYSPRDLIPLCGALELPLVYDVHHHRCHKDGLSIERATELALKSWGRREPLFHLSSPREGWQGENPRPHSDYIRLGDLPRIWEELDCTVEIEAKAKELAVLKLAQALRRRVKRGWNAPRAAYPPKTERLSSTR
jgi:UV DNA damage endonuclease